MYEIRLISVSTIGQDEIPTFKLSKIEIDWLRKDVESPSAMVAIKKKSLVNKLEDLSRSKYFKECKAMV